MHAEVTWNTQKTATSEYKTDACEDRVSAKRDDYSDK